MIVNSAAFIVTPGRNGEALEYFHAVAKAAERLTGVRMRVLTSVTGTSGQFLLVSEFDSVAAWDTARKMGLSNAALQKMVAEAGKSGMFTPGSITRSIWEDV